MPFLGVLADRYERRRLMMLSDATGLVSVLILAVAASAGRLSLPLICACVTLTASAASFQWLVYSAATTMLVPNEQLGRANAMVQFSQAAAQIAPPLFAGALVATAGIHVALWIDAASFAVALATLAAVRFPPLQKRGETAAAESASLLREATFGWSYIVAQPGLVGLLVFFAVINFTVAMGEVAFTPLVLGLTTTTMLGTMIAMTGVGFLAGSALLTLLPPKRTRWIAVLLGFGALAAMSQLLTGLVPSVAVLIASAFLFGIAVPGINTASQTIWQRRVEPDKQGRVFAVRSVVAMSCAPFAYIAAGPLVDKVLEPMLREGGLLHATAGRVIGIGAGRGAALLFVALGLATLALVILSALRPAIRNIEVVPAAAESEL